MIKIKNKKVLIYGLGFVLFFLFSTLIYGEVFLRAARESYVSSDPELMKFVADQAWGNLYWLGRYILLVYNNLWLGGLFMAGVLTLTAFMLDRTFCCRGKWAGIGFVVPALEMAWLLYIGTSLYHIGEPARLTVIPMAGVVVVLVMATVAWLLRKNKVCPEKPAAPARPYGALVSLVAFAALVAATYGFCHNEVLSARMKNNLDDRNWDSVIEDGLSASHPDRSIAVSYCAALIQKNLLLERVFEFSFNFAEMRLTNKSQNEATLYCHDANFYAGLVNISYENCINLMVTGGPRLHLLKRMLMCALLNDEQELARKYLRIIDAMPFNHDFVEKYAAFVGNEELILSDPVLRSVVSLRPRAEAFEQQYRQPCFLGYNVGLLSGSDNTLITSAAACLYSKNLPLMMTRANVFQQQGKVLPIPVQQAIAIASIKDKSVRKRFPTVSEFYYQEVSRFANDAVPFLEDKDKTRMREELEEKWKGSYYYYYYCMNAPKMKSETKTEDKGGVN